MSPSPPLRWLLMFLGATCAAVDTTSAASPAGAKRVDGSLAIVRLTRTLVYDDHVAAGGRLPDVDVETMRVVLDYGARTAGTRPVVRTYTARIAVPRDRPRSWHLRLGDDFELLIATRGFVVAANAVRIEGRVKSNYRLQLEDGRAAIGPNAFGFAAQAIGQPSVVQVMNDETATRVYREFEEAEIETLTNTMPESVAAGFDESVEAQQRRSDAWTPVTKRTLR